jgi:DNA-binding CsgD family transcriptional regulator
MRIVSQGRRYLAAAVAPRLATFEGRCRDANAVLGILSPREREVFRLASECGIAREMADELCIARKTVDTHLHRINRKLGLRNMAELVRLAASFGPDTRPSTVEASDDSVSIIRGGRLS